jgi:hypothetical protein
MKKLFYCQGCSHEGPAKSGRCAECGRACSRESYFYPAVLLALVFVTLKLAQAVAWSWWWVLSPLLPAATAIPGIVTITVVDHAVRRFARRIWR